MPQTISIYPVELDNRGYEFYPDMEKEVPDHIYKFADKILENPDGEECYACDQMIGFILHEEDTDYGERASMRFSYYWVVTDGEHIWALCEDCSNCCYWLGKDEQ